MRSHVLFKFRLPFDQIRHLVRRSFFQRIVKHDGVWNVNKSDLADVFPSDFHAHNSSSMNEVLDLYTGVIWDKRTKKLVGCVSRSQMKLVHQYMLICKEAEIADKANDKDRFSYLNRSSGSESR